MAHSWKGAYALSYVGYAVAACILHVGDVGAACTPSGTTTPNLALCEPASGETGWATYVNGNFTTIDNLFNTSSRLLQSKGGLAIDTSGVTNGQIPIGNTTGNVWALATITGTSNQVTVTNGASSITLSTPQNLNAAATPSFSHHKDTNGLNWLVQSATSNAVNGLQLTNAATGNPVVLSPGGSGSDTNIGLTLASKGTGTILLGSNTSLTQVRTTQQTAPTCSSNCGTGGPTVTGTDSAGIVNLGTTPSSAFVVTFNGTWAAAPSCTVTAITSAANYVTKAASTTTTLTVSVAAGPSNSDKYAYVCLGVQ